MAVGSKGSTGGGGPRSQNKAKQTELSQPTTQSKGTSKQMDSSVPVKTEVVSKVEPLKLQPTAEQLRLAQITASSRKNDPDEEKVQQLMDLSNKSLDACLSALYDADNDLAKAFDILLEGGEDMWEVSGKKKKQKPVKSIVPEVVEEEAQNLVDKRNDISSWDREDRGSRTRGGAPPRFRGRGRGREGVSDGPERGRGGRGRGRGGARGTGRGGYRGGGGSEGTVFDSPMETWGGTPQEKPEEELKVDNWGDDFPAAEDWDNDEYTVSLADTKVFTASTVAIQEKTVTVDPSLANGDKFHEPEPVKAPRPPVGPLSHQSLDLNLLLQKSSSAVQQQNQTSYLSSYSQQASETLKAAIGVGVPSQQNSNSLFSSSQVVQSQFSPNTQLQHQRAKLAKPKMPPPSKIPSSAVEMPDDSVSQLDIQFGGLEFGADSSGLEFGSSEQGSSYGSESHTLLSNKNESYGGPVAASAPATTPAPQSQQKPSAFSSGVAPAYTPQQTAYTSTPSGYTTTTTASQPSQATSTYQSSSNYPSGFTAGPASNYGASYSAGYPSSGYGAAPTAVNKLAGPAATQSYESTTVTSSSTSSMSVGSFGLTPSASQANAPAAAQVSAVSQRVAPVTGSGLQANAVGKGVGGMPPGVPTQMLGTAQYIMGQAPPGLPFAYAGLQQPVYSMEDMQNMQYLQRYQHMAPTAGYIDMPGFQNTTSSLGARETALAGYDPSKFQRNDNNSPVPAATTLTGQAGGTQYMSPAAAAPLAAAPTYAYFYSNVPSGFQAAYGAPAAALYPVSAATTGATVSSYGKSPSASQAHYGYGGYDNNDYTKTAYVNQSVSKTAADMGVGASVYAKTAAHQLSKTYEKAGFHTGTPPPFGMTGSNTPHLGNPGAGGYPQMFIPAMPHQSAHSMMHQQLHSENVNSQRASAAAQAKAAQQAAKPAYGGSYWSAN